MLFNYATIKNTKFANRIILAPVCTLFGLDSARARSYYKKRAAGGVGLIITENISIYETEDIKFVESLKVLVKEIHDYDCKIIAQLKIEPFLPNKKETLTVTDASLDNLQLLIAQLAKSALVCEAAGFDGVEVHGAHGYFLANFFSPLTNFRKDYYGGSVKNRMHFALDCVSEIESLVSDNFLLSYRLSADELTAEGVSLTESIDFAGNLEDKGVDVIHVSAGRADCAGYPVTPDKSASEAIFAHLSKAVKAGVNIPVIAVGKLDNPEVAEKILQEQCADFVALGRTLIADPEWPNKVKEGRIETINQCLYCNHCIKTISKGRVLTCAVNSDL